MSDVTNPQGSEPSASDLAAQLTANTVESQLSKVEQPREPTPEELTEQVSAAEPEEDEPELEAETDSEDEDDAEADAEDQEDDESESAEYEDDEEPKGQPKYITLKDGTRITAEEAALGYMRQSDYTQKTQAVADKEREVTKQAEQRVEQAIGQVAEQAQLLQRLFIGETPNWAELSKTMDPYEYQQAQAEWIQKTQAVQNAMQMGHQAREQNRQRRVNETLNALQSDPSLDWADQGKLKEGLNVLTDYLQTNGYTDDEIQFMAMSSRFITQAEKARKYDELMAGAPAAKKKVSQKPKPTKAGAKRRPKAERAKREAQLSKRIAPQNNLTVKQMTEALFSS
jgi:hypothetical protein